MTNCKFGLRFGAELQIPSPYKFLAHLKTLCSVQTQGKFFNHKCLLLASFLLWNVCILQEKKINFQ